MESRAKLALVLVLGGIGCILASLGAITYLYHEHAAQVTAPHQGPGLDNFGMFLVSVGLPSLATLVIGTILTAIGIKTGLNDKAP